MKKNYTKPEFINEILVVEDVVLSSGVDEIQKSQKSHLFGNDVNERF